MAYARTGYVMEQDGTGQYRDTRGDTDTIPLSNTIKSDENDHKNLFSVRISRFSLFRNFMHTNKIVLPLSTTLMS